MKKVILCVDDESIVLESLRSQLENCLGSEFSYEFAENGVEGLELVEELYQEGLEIALVISDWLMPRMKGETLAIDMPGYGLTKVNPEDKFTYDTWVQLASDFIDAERARDPRPIVLYGLIAGSKHREG